MKQNLLKIINHYGLMKQLKYFQSEIYELNEAVIQHEEQERHLINFLLNIMEPLLAAINNREVISSTDAIRDEIADVMVMLKQIQYHYGIDDIEIVNIMKFKIKRQLERIESEEKED